MDTPAASPQAVTAPAGGDGAAAAAAPPAFVHLHVHSDYSILDGACRVDKLCAKAAALGQKAVAVTDHQSMAGAIELCWSAAKHGIKPIIGCEFYCTPAGIADHGDNTRHHLVLLARNYAGYQTLCRLTRIAYSDEGFYYKARIDHEALRQHHDNLICLSACIAGEIPDYILRGREDKARKTIEFFIDLFGKENFFLELQLHAAPGTDPAAIADADHRDLVEQEVRVNQALIRLAREYGIGVVATNDAHYLDAADFHGHDALLCIGTQSQLADQKRLRFSGDQFYIKSGAEMAALFADCPEALSNTVRIAERCDFVMPTGVNHYPVFRLPDASDDPANPKCPIRRAYLRGICLRAMASRYRLSEPENPDYVPRADEPDATRRREILARLDFELETICRAGYVSYFLVVWDFINHARSLGIPVGPGRGSGAGSIVAYLTGITDLDPLQYGLLFERFLNPDRVSPPDFDVDFCERRRGEVIEYVREKYGAASVAQIGTFGTLKAKAVLKDVARVMGVPFADANRLVAPIPTDPKMTLAKALEIPEVRDLHERQEWVRSVFEKGKVLEGLNRNPSIHACGVIIGDQPLEEVVPLARGANKEWITQFPAVPCEALGLLKMDFLGLKTLTIIQDALDMVNEQAGTHMTANDIPADDQRTYDLLNRGQTVGVFQLESGGMQDLCRNFRIGRLEEIIALVALYRPGPMEFIPTYINCKLGRETPEYETKEMRALLSETHGIMVYQEQIMQVCQAVAGFSLAEADLMRRAIGKKKEEEMLKYGEKFIQGVITHGGYSREIGESIWKKILRFASYGFNKSHSACYALLGYRTAYLKANHPAEFMAAVLNGELGNADKLAFYIAEARRMGLPIQPPDVNRSQMRFGVSDGVVLFGLNAVKGVGSAAAEAIIAQRRQGGPFKSLLDLCERVGDSVNRRVLENLARAGAFDCFGLRRCQVFAMIDDSIRRAQRTIADRRAGQGSLFDFMPAAAGADFHQVPPDLPEWDDVERLRYEKELLGFYVTGHPTDQYADLLHTFQLETIAEVAAMPDRSGTRVGGVIGKLEMKRSKQDGKPWTIMTIEGRDCEVECMVFSDRYAECGAALVPDQVVLVDGIVDRRGGDSAKLVVERVLPIAEAPSLLSAEVHVRLRETEVDEGVLDSLRQHCSQHAGTCPILLCTICEAGEIAVIQPDGVRIANTPEFRAGLHRLLGADCLLQKAVQERPKPRDRRRPEFVPNQPAQ